MADTERQAPLPLSGVRVIEFAHMIMGPSCGMLLGDLGADVIKVEPIEGDHTRKLVGSGAGFFPMYNRNKKSLALDLKSPAGLEVALRLVAQADIVAENFKPGTMERLGLGYEALARLNPRLIYVTLKGFLRGPYDQRTALDEVVQMMGGMAYMTGRPGDPLRAGVSVNDVMGGLFGALGAIAALRERDTTGRGQLVQSALFENAAFLVGQHMLQFAVTGQPAAPMPARISAWAIYDVFTVQDGGQVFLSVVSDSQWRTFCDVFAFAEWKADPTLATNADRVRARPWLMPLLRDRLSSFSVASLCERFETNGLPYAPINRPEDLLDDPHLLASGGLAPMTLADGSLTRSPLLPILLDDRRPGIRLSPPRVGEHTLEVLRELGYEAGEIERLEQAGAVRSAPADSGA